MGRDRARAAARQGQIIGLDTTARTGAIMVRKDSKIKSVADLRNVPIAVTWHAGTFYAAIEVLEAAGVPFDEIKLVHANDRLDALLVRQDRGRGADGAAGQPRGRSRLPRRSPTCAGAAASSPATMSTTRPRQS